MSSTAAIPESSPAVRRKAAVATGTGNFMEWFDFAVYGFVATSIGRAFFPTESPTISLLSALAVFGVAFFLRPLGGFILGWVGDRFGRRPALATSIIIMGVATTLIAALPTYATIGVAAPVLLVVLRCLQGLSVGGEWTSSSAFLVEQAPGHRRGLYASVISMTAALGGLAGGLAGLLLSLSMSSEALDAWGWRMPFLVAAPLTAVGLYLRLKLDETPVFQQLRREERVSRNPIRSASSRNWRQIGLVLAAASVMGLGYYYLVTFTVNFLSENAGFTRTSALVFVSIGLAIYAMLCPFAGLLSDRIGRRPVLIAGSAGFLVLGVPAFALMGQGSVGLALTALILLAVCEALANVPTVAALVELFPPSTRVTGSAIGYNLGLAFIAGPGPFIGGALVAATGLGISPAFYLCGVALLGGVVLLAFLPETGRVALAADEPLHAERPEPTTTT
ncbi:MAG: MFS transporter [Streptosporangiales bacterium]|nr:MFS transporter [Streptosporangiales bacterium]